SRGMWWYGQNTVSSTTYQNDLAVISSNSFGYAPRATGSTVGTAHALTVSGGTLSASGVLESMTQNDYWSFSTSGGTLSFTVSAPFSSALGTTYGNLEPKIELIDSSGSVLVSWQDPGSSSVSWSGGLAAGSYYIVVGSHGISSAASATNYGFDVGSYTISGTVSSLPSAPTGLSTTPAVNQITLTWNSSGVTSYNIYRATVSGQEGSTPYQTGVTTTSFIDTGLTDGQTYFYEVSAVNSSGESALSSEVSARPNPPPSVINPASADPNPITGTTTNLSVLGVDNIGETLTYTWAVTSQPTAATPRFTVNGTADAINTTVEFNEAGTYTFQVTLADPSGLTATSSVTVVVIQTETSISINPSSSSVLSTTTQQFGATALDQFGQAMTSQPTFTWTVDDGGAGGWVSGTGLYTAPNTTSNGAD